VPGNPVGPPAGAWHSGPVLIDTERLRIRDWTLDDAPAALDIQSRVEVVQWLGDGPPNPCTDLDDARARIERWRGRDDPPLGFWAVEVTDDGPLRGRVIGSVLLVPLPNGDGDVEIGWHLHPDAWGHGYASEAARAVLRHGFDGGLEEVNAVTHLTNGPSQAVCRRIGMEHRGVVERWYEDPSEHFVIAREAWSRDHGLALD
jgi:RimJ/RimL family protein N-acetyltransferase